MVTIFGRTGLGLGAMAFFASPICAQDLKPNYVELDRAAKLPIIRSERNIMDVERNRRGELVLYEPLAPYSRATDFGLYGTGVGILLLSTKGADGSINGSKTAQCSAFVISDREIATSEHCLSHDASTKLADITFIPDYYDALHPSFTWIDIDVEPVEKGSTVFPSEKLDYTILKTISASLAPYNVLKFTARLPKDKDALNIIHHPGGEFKTITRAKCYAQTLPITTPSECYHTCSTDEGSSGAPLLWGNEVFAVHAGGVPGASLNRAIPLAEIARHSPEFHRIIEASAVKKETVAARGDGVLDDLPVNGFVPPRNVQFGMTKDRLMEVLAQSNAGEATSWRPSVETYSSNRIGLSGEFDVLTQTLAHRRSFERGEQRFVSLLLFNKALVGVKLTTQKPVLGDPSQFGKYLKAQLDAYQAYCDWVTAKANGKPPSSEIEHVPLSGTDIVLERETMTANTKDNFIVSAVLEKFVKVERGSKNKTITQVLPTLLIVSPEK